MSHTLGPLELLSLGAAGMVAGFANVSAGGGSLLTMPLMIFLGLPEGVANATARVAILVQNASALSRYREAGRLSWRPAVRVAIPGCLGAVVGCVAALHISPALFRTLLGWVTLLCACFVLWPPARTVSDDRSKRLPHPLWLWPPLLLVGFYGGLIQAGVGYLILFVLTVVGRTDLVEANILKLVIVGAYTPIAIAVFASKGWVALLPALSLSLGQALGGYAAASLALRKGAVYLRIVLALVVAVTAIKLLWSG